MTTAPHITRHDQPLESQGYVYSHPLDDGTRLWIAPDERRVIVRDVPYPTDADIITTMSLAAWRARH